MWGFLIGKCTLKHESNIFSIIEGSSVEYSNIVNWKYNQACVFFYGKLTAIEIISLINIDLSDYRIVSMIKV